MAKTPTLQQISDVYYALRASGVQRFPKPQQRVQGEEHESEMTLFLFDFWVSPDSRSTGSDTEPVPPLLKRLLERLPWGRDVTVFPVFDGIPKSPQIDPVDANVASRLQERLAQLNQSARRIVCFGWRAGSVLACAADKPQSLPPESFNTLAWSTEKLGVVDVLVLPDVRELEAIPEWRGRVWESLLAFNPC